LHNAPALARTRRDRGSRLFSAMSPTWIWMQAAIVVFVVIGMIVAITKLA
jgi:type II secretory pathway component PulF